MSTNRIEVDPSGDTLVILPRKHPSYGYSSFTQIGSSESLQSQPELHFLCSKKHLTLASCRADKIFASGFKEAIPEETDGLHYWKFEAMFDPVAFDIVIKIIHGRNRDIPRTVNLELLAEIAAVVDDLECHDNVWFFAKGWLADLIYIDPPTMCKEVAQFILISFVFNDPILFEASTKTAITSNLGAMPTFGLPIRPKILKQIEERRQMVLDDLIDDLYDLEQRLLRQKLGCSFGCRSMLLGTLIQNLKACSLHSPRPPQPFFSLSIRLTVESLRNFQSPKHYSSVQDSPLGRHSGTWNLYSHPTSKNQFARREVPERLVRHNCSLEDLINPLLQTAETEAKGLRLAEYLSL